MPNGTVAYSNPPEGGIYPALTIASFACDEGFTLVGAPRATCFVNFSFENVWFENRGFVNFEVTANPRCEGIKMRLLYVQSFCKRWRF